jgi:hypothetical protein
MNRTKSIKIRLTDDELRQLKACAGMRGVSALLRVRALGPDPRQIQIERLAFLAEFARARNLLNQIARNSQPQTPLALIEIVSQLIVIERQITNLKKS